MYAAVFALVAPLLLSLAAASATEPSLHALAKSCKFTLSNREFDLCPVFEGNSGGWTINTERKTPPTVTKAEYKISFQGPLRRSRRLPSEEQCPDGTWICLIRTNTRPKHEDEEPRVLEVCPVAGELTLPNKDSNFSPTENAPDFSATEKYQPGLNITTRLVPSNNKTRHDILHMHLHGGYHVYKQQKADFQFVCDHSAEEPTAPTALWQWNGTHTFEWHTKHACGTRLAQPDPKPAPPGESDDESDADAPPDDAEDPETPGEYKLFDPDFFGSRTRRSMMTLAASSAMLIAVCMYLVYFPPRRLRRLMMSYAKTHPSLLRSRVGERVLVRWAHEDFGFDGTEEDTMVNGGGEFDGIPMDEHIPLKPSPKQLLSSSYGSA